MTSEVPSISVITVVYNGATTLEKTIQSVLSQRNVNVEYIIVDGGSTDATLSIVERYQSGIARWVSEADKGIYDAMNKGIRMSNGEWIIFLNSGDTFVDKDSLSESINELMRNHIVPDVAFGDAIMVQPNGSSFRMKMSDSLTFLIRNNICHQSMLYRRNCFDKIGFFDINYRLAADFEHLLRLKWQGAKMRKLNIAISRYPLDGLSAKKENISRIWKERMQMYCASSFMPLIVRLLFWSYAKLAYEFRKRA